MRGATLAAVLALGCGSATPTTEAKRVAEPAPAVVAPASPPKNPRASQPKKESPRPPDPQPEPVKSRPEAFKDALAAAEKLGQEADSEEPELTKRALSILTVGELTQAQLAIQSVNTGLVIQRDVDTLLRFNLFAALNRVGRKVAREDREFPLVAEVFWDQASGAKGVLAMMNAWGTVPALDRSLAVAAVKNNLTAAQMLPQARNTILTLGGQRWLEGERP